MKRAFLAIGILLTAAVCHASTISSKFYWAAGTLVKAVTPKSTPQSVEIKVGTVNKTATNIVVVGTPGLTIPAGTPFQILEAGSQPFAATYSKTTLSVDVGGGLPGREPVAITTAGVLSDGIGYQVDTSSLTPVHLYLPPCTIGGMNFINGLTLSIDSNITGFTFTVPTASADTVSTMTFPVVPEPSQVFLFEATGNGQLIFYGIGPVTTLTVGGRLTGTGTVFTSATLSIGSI